MQVWGYIRGARRPRPASPRSTCTCQHDARGVGSRLADQAGHRRRAGAGHRPRDPDRGPVGALLRRRLPRRPQPLRLRPQRRAGPFEEKWVEGLVDWWNIELKDRTPAWAAEVTTLPSATSSPPAREFGTTRPAIALFERGAHAHSNGVFNGMAIHTLNALVGSLFAKGGLGTRWARPTGRCRSMRRLHGRLREERPLEAAAADRPEGHADGYLLANNMMQEVGPNHLAGSPTSSTR
jgi:hypothetical protein